MKDLRKVVRPKREVPALGEKNPDDSEEHCPMTHQDDHVRISKRHTIERVEATHRQGAGHGNQDYETDREID